MKEKDFEAALDRYGADLDSWPAEKARRARLLISASDEARRSHQTMIRLESLLGATRPTIAPARVRHAVSRAMSEIAAREEAHPSFLERIRGWLAAPLPRVAFATSLTAIGFGIGLLVGGPALGDRPEPAGILLMTASADDVLY